jgi:hypothetical protein
MKIFENKADSWEDKVNFVDDNNVFVGYDMGQSCCEYADWFISTSEKDDIQEDKGIITGLEDYLFDTNYFAEVPSKVLDEGSMVRFKLISKNKPDLYLHLFNSHNGYYSHGFEANVNGISWHNGSL